MFNKELAERVERVEDKLSTAMEAGTDNMNQVLKRLGALEKRHRLLVEFLELDYVDNGDWEPEYKKFPRGKKK